mmetsp:Transcript_112168/g.356450  ORF Transcript_112168/g.356450 Transcript_112168/m.356450 type:complete len:537 (-) Transcript_112168:40-1650(-)
MCRHVHRKKENHALKLPQTLTALHQGLVDQVVHEVVGFVSRRLASQVRTARLEPSHHVLTLAFEDLPAMEHAVVVQQDDVARLHHNRHHVALANFVDVLHILGCDLAEVSVVHVRHAHLRNGARTAVPQVPAVVVQIAEPHWLTSHGVRVDRGLGMLDGLEPPRIRLVRTVDHLQVHLELRSHYLQDQILQRLLHGLLAEGQGSDEVQVQVADRDPDFLLVDAAQHVLVHVPDDLCSVRDQELAATLRSRLEAAEGAEHRGLHKGRLVVEAHEVLSKRRLVHRLVHSILFADHVTQARGVDWVEAGVQLQCVIEGTKALGILHGLEVLEQDRAVQLQLLHDLLTLRNEVLLLGAARQPLGQVFGIDNQRRCLPRLRDVVNVDVVGFPDRARAVRKLPGEVLLRHGGRRGIHRGNTHGSAAVAAASPSAREHSDCRTCGEAESNGTRSRRERGTLPRRHHRTLHDTPQAWDGCACGPLRRNRGECQRHARDCKGYLCGSQCPWRDEMLQHKQLEEGCHRALVQSRSPCSSPARANFV